MFRNAASRDLGHGDVDGRSYPADVEAVTTRLPDLPLVPPEPLALFLDVDGTLIDLASRPDAVDVPAALKATLARLDERFDGAIALVSGRTIADLDRLFDPVRLRASGVHGAELRLAPGAAIEAAEGAVLPRAIIAAMEDIATAHPGTLVEDKRYSAAIHYRTVPEAGAALAQSLYSLVSGSLHLRILAGHLVYEIKHKDLDKGKAVERFMAGAPFEGRRPVYIGDDVTDEAGFRAAVAQGGLACAVGCDRAGATHEIATPADVRQWLARLAGLT